MTLGWPATHGSPRASETLLERRLPRNQRRDGGRHAAYDRSPFQRQVVRRRSALQPMPSRTSADRLVTMVVGQLISRLSSPRRGGRAARLATPRNGRRGQRGRRKPHRVYAAGIAEERAAKSAANGETALTRVYRTRRGYRRAQRRQGLRIRRRMYDIRSQDAARSSQPSWRQHCIDGGTIKVVCLRDANCCFTEHEGDQTRKIAYKPARPSTIAAEEVPRWFAKAAAAGS